MAANCPIFISYRRSDLSLEAEWLQALITTFFGEQAAFLDRREITSGTRWDDTLEQAVRSARLVLVLIGPGWLRAQAASGRRRLDDPDDWVRREVATAIEVHRQEAGRNRVYPVLMNGAAPIPRDWLPESLADLASFQWEPALQLQVRRYLDNAAGIHTFVTERLAELRREGLWSGPEPKPFRRDRVPSPYDIPDFQLPAALRLRRPEHPFLGLTYFRREDAAVFFGRRREIAEIIDAFKKGRDFIRLSGPSGTGKSSLLFAGLLPRLEGKGWRLAYLRRDPKRPLAQALEEALAALPADGTADALVILDQVEEILTVPNPAVPDELAALVAATARLLEGNTARERPVRLIWSYRKEFDGNLKAALRDAGVESTDYWLRNLDADGMREAITGVVRDADLQAEYGLEIDEGLADAVVAELLDRSAAEAVTPLLQLLLRRMWDRACSEPSENRRFGAALYEACKSMDLQELVTERLADAAADPALAAPVHAGLALDLLGRLVSEQDTCLSLQQAELVALYDDAETVTRLLRALGDRYLLVFEGGARCRLPHDTLARAVRLVHARSALPGQRASKLLDSKRADILARPEAVDFSLTDLRTLEEGLAGMRRLGDEERRAVKASRQRRAKEQRDLAKKNAELAQALGHAERDLLRAQCAELRGLLFRLQTAPAGESTDDARARTAEIAAVEARLEEARRLHMAALASAIGFRGDFDFLMRWEGVAGKVQMIGPSACIDPLTDLGMADAATIRSRYEFLLSPGELQAVVSLVGLKNEEAARAFEAQPLLKGIRLTEDDVARLVPEVVAPWWHGLLQRHPSLSQPDTPAAVHTALLSLALNIGNAGRHWVPLQPAIANRDWMALADGIEAWSPPRMAQRYASALQNRRREEAALIRAAIATAHIDIAVKPG